MRNKVAKKLRREARREIQRRTRRESAWWSRPRVFLAWARLGTFLLLPFLRRGTRLGRWWLAFVRSVPERGTRLVVR